MNRTLRPRGTITKDLKFTLSEYQERRATEKILEEIVAENFPNLATQKPAVKQLSKS